MGRNTMKLPNCFIMTKEDANRMRQSLERMFGECILPDNDALIRGGYLEILDDVAVYRTEKLC